MVEHLSPLRETGCVMRSLRWCVQSACACVYARVSTVAVLRGLDLNAREGGQYSNLMVQCKSMGIWDKWEGVLDMYRDVNNLFGDIVKVTKCGVRLTTWAGLFFFFLDEESLSLRSTN